MASKFITAEQLLTIYLSHTQVVTDSRQVVPGCLFFALKGERFDGNTFALTALEQGAAYAIVDNETLPANDKLLFVRDVLSVMQNLATLYRRLYDIPVLAITGSNGKTTTKELVHAVLESHFKTHATKGNFNNHFGVPITLLSMNKDTEIAVIEMGANHPGEIDALCRIAEPTLGLITNVGKAHLEGFGGFEGVKRTKSELYRYLAEKGGLVFINSTEEHLTDLAKGNDQIQFYGKNNKQGSDFIQIKQLPGGPFVKVIFESEGKSYPTNSQLIGDYNYGNIATAIAIGLYFNVPAEKIKSAIEAYVPSNNRSQLLKVESNTFILDAYNANPTSVRNALSSFGTLDAQKKWVILGAMKELGEYSVMEHEEIAQLCLSLSLDKIIFVGNEFRKSAEEHHLLWFENAIQLKEWIDSYMPENAHILVKGSRSVGLEVVVDSNYSKKH